VTKVLVRLGALGPDPFQVAVKDENGSMDPDDVGELANALESEQRGNPIILDSVWVPEENTYMVFAKLTAPLDFERTSEDDCLSERTLTIEIGSPDSEPCITKEIKLVRPPVVLMHGIWGNPCWEWPLAGKNQVCADFCPDRPTGGVSPCRDEFIVYRHNYGNTCAPPDETAGSECNDPSAGPFRNNMGHIRDASTAARLLLRRQEDVAAVQVDYVAHSMGGVLGRIYASTTVYRRHENFLAGDFHKFITANSPHFGSTLAPLLVTPDNIRTFCGCLFELLAGYEVDLGAVRDLRPDSPELCSLPGVDLRAHVLYSGDPCWPPDNRALIPLFCRLSTLDSIFGEDHDSIVEVSSQLGGLNSPYVTPFEGQYHDVAKHRDDYNNRVLMLLRGRSDGNDFSPGFGPRTCTPFTYDGNHVSQTRDEEPIPALVIASPLTGSGVSPNEGITVVTEAIKGFIPEVILLVARGTAVLLEAFPFQGTLRIPSDAIGAFPIRAFGRNEQGQFAFSNVVVLNVTVSETPTSLVIVPAPIVLTAYAPRQWLSVLATYPDGVTRNVTDPATGTAYISEDSNIATVTDRGLVTAKSPGTTFIRAANVAVEKLAQVVVLSVRNDWNNDGHIDLQDYVAFIECISGPAPTETPLVQCRDFFDSNGDVAIDLRDFAGFQRGFGNPGR